MFEVYKRLVPLDYLDMLIFAILIKTANIRKTSTFLKAITAIVALLNLINAHENSILIEFIRSRKTGVI